MAKKQFKAESKRLLDLMINSIYTHKEIFLRELISNASDAIDKLYYLALTDETLSFDRESYCITIETDRENRTLTITDTGIGMTKEELEENLGTIAKSGSLLFKGEVEQQDGYDIIGQFGVGFYSAFMVANRVRVESRNIHSADAFCWESDGADGYTVTPCVKETAGTSITLTLKEDTEDEDYSAYLDSFRLRQLVKKYSDFIRYPIRMEVQKSRAKEDDPASYEAYTEVETVNSMVPIWVKNKNELTDEDYDLFYQEKRYGFGKPLCRIHTSVDGAVRYNAILYIPDRPPFDFYTKEYEKGLELYANGVMIMEKCSDLIPDCFSFVKGLVDSPDLSLNISRELLQHDRQLQLIAKNLKKKIRSELLRLQKDDRTAYEEFFAAFGRTLKYALYASYGGERETLEDLLLFYSSTQQKPVTLAEYLERMQEGQDKIYYACGESNERIALLPQTEAVADRGYEILYLTDEVDEFALKMLINYKEKAFQSVSDSALSLDDGTDVTALNEANRDLLAFMQETLGDKVTEVAVSGRLKSHPVCLSGKGALSIEMEKVLASMPEGDKVKAQKVLELNPNHGVFAALQQAFATDREKAARYTRLLYNQALLIEGLPIADPVTFADEICSLMMS